MTPAAVPASLSIHGIRLLNLSLDEAIEAIDVALTNRTPTRIAFVNADCVNLAAANPDYRNALADMDWIFVDGVGMRIAGRLLDQPVRENVNGTDLFPRLCELMAQRRLGLYLLGAQPGVAADAAQWARRDYPGLRIAGSHHGYFKPGQTDQILENIRSSQSDVLLVALGAPRQEKWIRSHMTACGATIVIGVGGLFDYYSGRIPRAPLWMRRCGLEWVFRLLQEPGRLWRRYLLGNMEFLVRTVLERRRRRTPAATPATRISQRRNT